MSPSTRPPALARLLARPEPVAGELIALQALVAGADGEEKPRLFLLLPGDTEVMEPLLEALGEKIQVARGWLDELDRVERVDLLVCLHLPPTPDPTTVEAIARQGAPTWLQPGGGAASAENWVGWITAFARLGYLYDGETTARLQGPLVAAGGLLLRPIPLEPASALARLALALHGEQRLLARSRTLATGQSAHVSHLTRLIDHMDGDLAQLRRDSDRLRREVEEQRARWRALEGSPGYALLRGMQRLRARMAPPDSRREHLLTMGLGWFAILGRQGPGGLAVHLGGEVTRRGRGLLNRLGGYGDRAGVPLDVEPLRRRPVVPVHRAGVDIVVCVHNALTDVQRCLDSVVSHTHAPYRLLLVDDGSAEPTARYLEAFAREQSGSLLLRNDEATGYTRAANLGLAHSEGEFVVLLNSDTLVAPGWLDRLIACAESDPRIGLVGPLSNTASWQSVPEISLGGDWAENPLPPGQTVESWAAAIAVDSGRLYPSMPFLNGFCLLLRRALLEDLGLFDEDLFGAGYGEENDYALRARAAGWRLALADDTYVHHAQSRSYSHARRRELSERAAAALARRHDPAAIEQDVAYCRSAPVLAGIRARVGVLAERQRTIAVGGRRFGGRRLLFLLPLDGPAGGGNVVVTEAEAMQTMGVEVHIFNLHAKRPGFERAYPGLSLPQIWGKPEDVAHLALDYDAVVATWYESVAWMAPVVGKAVLGYYVQDFEPRFFPPGSPEQRRAQASYTAVPGLRCLTKTEWNRREVASQTGVDCRVIGPSVDLDRFRPRRDDLGRAGRPLHVVAMVRPSSPRRSPRLTMELLRRLSRRYGDRVCISVFGVDAADPGLAALPQDFAWRLAGVIDRDRVASLLGQADLFVDFSTYQAMGLTALEAMACGAGVIVPREGGAGSFACHGENALVVDTRSREVCWRALVRLVEDDALRREMGRRAGERAASFYPERAAYKMLEALFAGEAGGSG